MVNPSVALSYCLVPLRLGSNGFRLAAACVAVLATEAVSIAQESTTYTLLDEFGGVLYSTSSSSGLAVVADTAYRTRWVTWFEDEPPGGEVELWGRFERFGSPLTGEQAALMGPYFPSLSLQSTTQWSFGKQSFGNNQSGWQLYYPIWAQDQRDPAQVIASLPFDGIGMVGPRVESTGTVAPGSYERPAQPNTYPFNAGGQDITVRLRRGVWKAEEPDEASPGKWDFLLFSGAPDLEFEQQDETIFILSIQPDPFKAAAGDGIFDPDGIISAINDQAAMQQGFFTNWDPVYDRLFEQLTGGGTEQDWVTRDQRRDDILTDIQLDTAATRSDVSLISGRTGSMLTQLVGINTQVGDLLAAVTPTQVPPSLSELGEETPVPEITVDPDTQLPSVDDILPDTFVKPVEPPAGGTPIWNVDVPLGQLPMMGDAFGDQQFTVDLTQWSSLIQSVHTLVIVAFALMVFFGVIEETEKH